MPTAYVAPDGIAEDNVDTRLPSQMTTGPAAKAALVQATQLRPGKDHAMTVDEEVLRAHSALERIFRKVTLTQAAIWSAPADLCFRRGCNLFLRFGFGLRCFPPDRRGLRRHFLAIQISDATPTFDSHPMLLTHDAFYRTEGVPAQREIELGPAENRLWSTNRIAKNTPV